MSHHCIGQVSDSELMAYDNIIVATKDEEIPPYRDRFIQMTDEIDTIVVFDINDIQTAREGDRTPFLMSI